MEPQKIIQYCTNKHTIDSREYATPAACIKDELGNFSRQIDYPDHEDSPHNIPGHDYNFHPERILEDDEITTTLYGAINSVKSKTWELYSYEIYDEYRKCLQQINEVKCADPRRPEKEL